MQQLHHIIDRHNEIVDIVQRFSIIMAAPTFAQFLSASLVIATSVIDILLVSFAGLSYDQLSKDKKEL